MIRSGHFFHDLRELLGNALLLIGVLLVGAFLIWFVTFQFIYPTALLLGTIFGLRGLIGRRCPRCDGPLKESGAERDKNDAFMMHITWRCPRDGYEETEKTKGDAGLFGVN